MKVYILFSEKSSRYYVGQTADIDKRLKRHNQGLVRSTKGSIPWELVLLLEVSNRSKAVILENLSFSTSKEKLHKSALKIIERNFGFLSK